MKILLFLAWETNIYVLNVKKTRISHRCRRTFNGWKKIETDGIIFRHIINFIDKIYRICLRRVQSRSILYLNREIPYLRIIFKYLAAYDHANSFWPHVKINSWENSNFEKTSCVFGSYIATAKVYFVSLEEVHGIWAFVFRYLKKFFVSKYT